MNLCNEIVNPCYQGGTEGFDGFDIGAALQDFLDKEGGGDF